MHRKCNKKGEGREWKVWVKVLVNIRMNSCEIRKRKVFERGKDW